MNFVNGVIVLNKKVIGAFTLQDDTVSFRIGNSVCTDWTYEAFSTMADAYDYDLIVT